VNLALKLARAEVTPASVPLRAGFLYSAWAFGALVLEDYAFQLSRDGRPHAQTVFWIGLLAIVLPAVALQAFARLRRNERVLLVVLAMLALYAVKVLHDPFGFIFPDELSHIYNANQILATGALPSQNTVLPITTSFPGLELGGAQLSAMSGLSTFASGLIVIGVVRVVLALALFLLFERVSGSEVVAGLGTTLYFCDPNFLYWSAQFSYESLALPLALAAFVVILMRPRHSATGEVVGWTALGVLLIVAVTVTHHVTSYALAAGTVALAIASLFDRGRGWRSPWDLAIVAVAAPAAWLFTKASQTLGYLGPIFSNAYDSVSGVVSGKSGARHLFSSYSNYHAPLLERAVAIVGLGVLAVLVVTGAIRQRRRMRSDPLVGLVAVIGVMFLAAYLLRFAPDAWEIANRTSDFLFVGAALTAALSGVQVLLRRRLGPPGAVVYVAALGLAFCSGAISGWPPLARLARPIQVRVANVTLHPQGVMAAQWMQRTAGENQAVVADEANGRLLLDAGELAYVGRYPDARVILEATSLRGYPLKALRALEASYVLIDRRQSSTDNLVGYFFDQTPNPPLLPWAETSKLDREPDVSRVLDTGNIALYDVRGLLRGD
jgi:hypothetical protein